MTITQNKQPTKMTKDSMIRTMSSDLGIPLFEALARHLPLLESLDHEAPEVQDFAELGELCKVQDGEYYMVEGQDPMEQMTMLLEGSMKVLRDDKTIVKIHAPIAFGLSSLLGRPMPVEYSFMPVGDCKVFTLSRKSFEAFLSKHPGMTTRILANVLDDFEPATGAHLAQIPVTKFRKDRAPAKDPESIRIVMYDAKPYEVEELKAVNEKYGYEIEYLEETLNEKTASLAKGADVVGLFVHDRLDRSVLKAFGDDHPLFVCRCAGFDFVDREACDELQVSVARVPSYSPSAIAEMAIAMMLSLNRKLFAARQRVRHGDFSLDGLVGFTMRGKTVGVVGTGKIGFFTCQILLGFGCRVLCYDVYRNPSLLQQGVPYVSLDELYKSSDIISLHCPLLKDTYHMIDETALSKMKKGVMLINTSRGGLVKSSALVAAIKSGQVSACGLDVVEREGDYFYRDMSSNPIKDDDIARLIGFNNVLLTSHQAYLTKEALHEIATTTFKNIDEYLSKGKRMKALTNSVNTVEYTPKNGNGNGNGNGQKKG